MGRVIAAPGARRVVHASKRARTTAIVCRAGGAPLVAIDSKKSAFLAAGRRKTASSCPYRSPQEPRCQARATASTPARRRCAHCHADLPTAVASPGAA
jgi:hypothetical protein